LMFLRRCWFYVTEMHLLYGHQINLPHYSDFVSFFYCLTAMITLRIICVRLFFKSLGRWILPMGKWDSVEGANRVDRFASVLFKLIYFIMISSWSVVYFHDKIWFPRALGGFAGYSNQNMTIATTLAGDLEQIPAGDIRHCWVDYPKHELDPPLTTYYMWQLAYHAHSLVFQVFLKHRNDFLEMVLHHMCAIFLIIFSYLMNFIRIGTLVFYVHDLADIFSFLIKVTVDTTYTNLIISIYFSLLVSWGYLRIFVYPFYIIGTVIVDYPRFVLLSVEKGYYFFLSMLCLLYLLHVYWYSLFLFMGFKFFATGKAQDIQQELKSDKSKLATNEKID